MISVGDCLELAIALPDDSVDCIVTSPPYWGLRDYGTPEAWGLEPTLTEYLERLGSLFDQIRRALKPTGTCWVNLGDAYAATSKGSGGASEKQDSNAGSRYVTKLKLGSLKPKDLIGLPWRVAFMLQDQGWYLRSDIIWHKPNPMPESVRDRPTKAHEYLFLLTKSPKYWYDADAIRTPFSEETKQLSYDTMDYKRRDVYKTPDCWDTAPGSHGTVHRNGREKGESVATKNERSGQRTKENLNANWDASEEKRKVSKRDTFARASKEDDVPGQSMKQHRADREEVDYGSCGANARTVWTIPAVGFAEAHFATFPPELPRRCILAGCPEGGLVLDPFAGSGTTGMVAKHLGRKFIGFEINPEYAAMAVRRIDSVTPSLFLEEAV